MSNCGCEYNRGQGVRPSMGPCCKPVKEEPPVKVATITYQPQYGTPTDGPYQPEFGKYTNTLVHYLANDAIVFYDGEGAWTLITSDDKLDEAKQYLQEQLEAEVANRIQADEFLQENINQLANKEAQDVENLQTNINTEVNRAVAAEEKLSQGLNDENSRAYNAEQELSQRIEDIVNSPDVRYIEANYADLEALDKSKVGDKDYARVLQDENHDGASTYYQFDLATQEWNYIGEVGSYYTKEQIDDMIGNVESLLAKLNTGEGI